MRDVISRNILILLCVHIMALVFVEKSWAIPPELLKGELEIFVVNSKNKTFKNVAFNDAQGNTKTLKDFKGEVLVVNIWSETCPPCIKELPSLDKLYGALGHQGITVLPVLKFSSGIDAGLKVYQNIGIKHLNIYESERGTFRNIRLIPTTLIFDPLGRYVGYLVGEIDWNSQEVKEFLLYLKDR